MKNLRIMLPCAILVLVMPAWASSPALPKINLSNYIPDNILKIMPQETQKNYAQQIAGFVKEGSDRGHVRYLVDGLLEDNKWYARAEEETQKQQVKKVCKEEEKVARQMGKMQLEQPGKEIEYLYKKPETGSITLNACTYSMLADADVIYNALQKTGVVTAQDLPPSACPKEWAQIAKEKLGKIDALQPTNEDILTLIKDRFNILRHGHYAILDEMENVAKNPAKGAALMQELDGLNEAMGMPLIGKAIDDLKNHARATQVFLVNKPGHWFVVVAHKQHNQIRFYISDRDQAAMKEYHRTAINLLKKLMA